MKNKFILFYELYQSRKNDVYHRNFIHQIKYFLYFRSHLPSTRTRLQGLKQLSVEKLASLRQKLAESRTKQSSHNKQGSLIYS